MKCRNCSSSNTRITVTEHKEQVTWRYCKCLDCQSKFKTVERYEYQKRTPLNPAPIPSGCANYNSRFTPNDIYDIRKRYERGDSGGQIAMKYCCNRATIHKIVTYKTYKDVS